MGRATSFPSRSTFQAVRRWRGRATTSTTTRAASCRNRGPFTILSGIAPPHKWKLWKLPVFHLERHCQFWQWLPKRLERGCRFRQVLPKRLERGCRFWQVLPKRLERGCRFWQVLPKRLERGCRFRQVLPKRLEMGCRFRQVLPKRLERGCRFWQWPPKRLERSCRDGQRPPQRQAGDRESRTAVLPRRAAPQGAAIAKGSCAQRASCWRMLRIPTRLASHFLASAAHDSSPSAAAFAPPQSLSRPDGRVSLLPA